MALSLSGRFQETTFFDVLEILRLHKATGTIVCVHDRVEKSVCVKNGQVIFASSTDIQDRLGEVLVKAGKISRSQLEKVLQLHQKSAGLIKIGALFVENGYLTPKDLFNGLKLQVNQILHSVLTWNTGEYRFEERLPDNVIPLVINIEDLLRDAKRQSKKKA